MQIMDDQIYVKVFFLDNSYKTFLVASDIKASEFTMTMANKLGFQNVEEDGYWFGLYESFTGVALDRPLSKNDEIRSLVIGWGSNPPNKLVFLIKLFFDSLIHSEDQTVQYYRYIQGVHSVVTGQYSITEEMAVRLACLQFRAKFGDEVEFTKDFLGGRIVEFISQKLLKTKPAVQWNELIYDYFNDEKTSSIKSLSEDEASDAYLQTIETLPIYGSTLYKIYQNPQTAYAEDVVLTVNSIGIQLYRNDSSTPYHTYELGDLLRWGYVPGTLFYISIKSDQGKCLNFGSSVGNYICESMTSYAFGWLKHAELIKARKTAEEEGKVNSVIEEEDSIRYETEGT